MLAAAFLTASTGVCYRAVGVLTGNQRLVTHTHEVLAQLEATRGALASAEGNQRNFLFTGQANYLPVYEEAARDAEQAAGRLSGLVADNGVQAARAARLREAVS